MTLNHFVKVYRSFIKKNEDLVSEYESNCDDSIDSRIEEIYRICSNLLDKNSSIDIIDILKQALFSSVSKGCNIVDSLDSIVNNNDTDLGDLSSTERYFREVNDIYVKNNNNYDIVYCPENREKLIEMNLKTVIAIAKNYIGLGIPLEDLIGAGNLGLCVAYDKYDPSRAKLKDTVLEKVNDLPDRCTVSEIYDCIGSYISYGNIKKKFEESFNTDQVYTRDYVRKWVNKNIHNAKFNSVATMWITAYIINSINNESRVVRKPKVEISRDALENGSYSKEILLNIDAPINDDNDNTLGDLLSSSENIEYDIETQECYDIYKETLKILLTGVKSRDRSIFLKKFGIGLPRPFLPKEIAEQEGLSIARVSQIFQTVEQQIIQNASKYNVDIDNLLNIAKHIR